MTVSRGRARAPIRIAVMSGHGFTRPATAFATGREFASATRLGRHAPAAGNQVCAHSEDSQPSTSSERGLSPEEGHFTIRAFERTHGRVIRRLARRLSYRGGDGGRRIPSPCWGPRATLLLPPAPAYPPTRRLATRHHFLTFSLAHSST